jgi:hypothetical protein
VTWYDNVFELIDMRSFSNLWYWIALAVVWSSASHWVLGVPFDLIARARRQGGEAEADMRTLVGINTRRILYIARVAGLWLLGFVFFALTAMGMLGFGYGIEFAQAIFLIAAPMTLVAALSLRTSRKVAGLEEAGDLHRLLVRHRFAVQAIGMLSIFVTSMWGMYQNMRIGALY